MGTNIHPVITIDGPSGVGKGTAAQALAKILQWQLLDSGAIYRCFALWADQFQPAEPQEHELALLAQSMPLSFEEERVMLQGVDVSKAIRTESIAKRASYYAQNPLVRQALLEQQRALAQRQPLIADGRDMGTVVFPYAPLKIYLTADSLVRAQRRHQQLLSAGHTPSLDTIRSEIQQRDLRDQSRTAAPLKPAKDAVVIDNSDMNTQDTIQKILQLATQRNLIDA